MPRAKLIAHLGDRPLATEEKATICCFNEAHEQKARERASS
jgi:hypothetical protein